jgi:ADP-ribose pyrophosphatase YjhB (NUDIX family)
MVTCKFEDGGDAALRHAVVHALVLNQDNQILLTRRSPKLTEGGKWSFAGGYMDRDETLQETVAREVHEETGWEVQNIRFLSVLDSPERPNDVDRQNVAFNYVCEVVKQTGEPDWEVTEQQWFEFDKLPPQSEIAFDHYAVIQWYLKNKDKNHNDIVLNTL